MKVKLVKSKSEDRWYSNAAENLLGKTFKVHFSELASKDLQRSVFEILSGKHKGKFIDVRDTKIVVKLK
ncbi:MAG: hypothetical protein HWE21_00120 [Cytophagia bacterium]|nr:hypothetical protein [Cytophagia bacterium]NVK82689.1 hypothetical protein [Cytophagia bacterium]